MKTKNLCRAYFETLQHEISLKNQLRERGVAVEYNLLVIDESDPAPRRINGKRKEYIGHITFKKEFVIDLEKDPA